MRYAPVRDYLQVAQDEAVFENGYLQRVDHPDYDMAVGSPIRMSDTPATPGVAAPELGQHTEELLLEFGLEWEEIERLRAAGVI